jgi:mono/diheme cytochrome c family protein
MWTGVSLAAALLLCCAVRESNSKLYGALLVATVGLMVWTSDQGGKLTHGDDFLTKFMPARLRAVLGVPPPEKKHAPTASEGVLSPISASASGKVSVTFFDSRVAPIFDDKCVQCHGPHKKKGKLRLDTFENVMRGGKDGLIVKPGDPHGSEIVRRITLPRDNKDAMPAEGKPGLTAAEIKVIELWIASGASQILAAAEVRGAPPLPPPELASPPLAADYRPRSDKIQALQNELGVRLVPRSQNPTDGLILRTAGARERCDDAVIAKLAPVASLIVDAELAHTKITDGGLKTLSTFSNLRSLDLSHTSITSVGVRLLSRLDKLETLNLTATGVDDTGVAPLRHKARLKRLYLFETKCTVQKEK